MWYPIHAINLNLLQVEGRSDLFLKLEIYKKLLGVVVLCVTIPMGLVAMCWGAVVSSLLALVLNTYYTNKLIRVGLIKQLRDLSPALFYSFSMSAVVDRSTIFTTFSGNNSRDSLLLSDILFDEISGSARVHPFNQKKIILNNG